MEKAIPWSIPVSVEEIPEAGLHLELEAPEPARAAIARLAGVREIGSLSAAFDLTRRGAGVHVAGEVSGRVGQTCVVTLEPLETDVTERVNLRFLPQAAAEETADIGYAADADEEPPEPLVDRKIDLGAVATEHLMLGIDPYPRKPGAEFAPPKVEDAGAHPFAALAALKKRSEGNQS